MRWRQPLLKYMAIVMLAQFCLALPGQIWPAYLDSPIGLLLVAPFLSVYLFHSLGVPGLLEHSGMCGWGWCAPTLLGWVAIVITWLFSVRLEAGLLRLIFSARAARVDESNE